MADASHSAPPPLGPAIRFSYGLGSLSFGVGAVAFSGGVLQLFFNQALGLPAIWVGTAIMLSIVVDAVIDPLIGRFSDRLRAPFGRRHTLMYASALPTALGFWLLFNPPAGLSPPALLGFMVVTLLATRIAASFYEIPSISLAPELASDTHERTSLMAWRWFFLVVGLGVGIIVLYQGFLRQDASNPTGVLNVSRYGQFGAVAAVMMAGLILISTAATHSRIKYLHVPSAERTTLRDALRDSRAVLSDRQLLLIMGAGFLMSIAQGATDGLSPYEGLHFWGLPPQVIGYLVGAVAVAAFIALPLATPLSKAMGKRPAMLVLYVVWIATTAGAPLLRLAGVLPPSSSPALLAILIANFVVSAACALTASIILTSMMTDALDAVARRTGQRSEGLTFAVFGVLTKWATGAGAFAAGAIITLVHFPARAAPGSVPAETINDLVLVRILLVLALNLTAILLLRRLAGSSAPAIAEVPPNPAKAAS